VNADIFAAGTGAAAAAFMSVGVSGVEHFLGARQQGMI